MMEVRGMPASAFQRDEVPVDLFRRGRTDVGHPGSECVSELALARASFAGGTKTHVWSAISFPATYQSVTRV